jgi:HAD superfamily hydrolase (TIGR01490 family)
LSRGIAFFDFDGTITTQDTMIELIKFSKGSSAYYKGLSLLSPVMVAMKLNLVSTTYAKERLLSFFFKNLPISDFENLCHSFTQERLPEIIRPLAIEKINEHRSAGDEVMIVSASASHWVAPWSNQLQIPLLSTVLEIKNGMITGKLASPNCNGPEKVRRIKESVDISRYEKIWCYGDTKGDKPMLQLATFAFYKPFRN